MIDLKGDFPNTQFFTEPCPKLLKIGDRLFCQRIFLFIDDTYKQEICFNCYEYDYCIQGVDYLQQLLQFGVRSLEDILLLNQKQFCEPRSIDESIVTKWKHMLTSITPYERKFLQQLLKRKVNERR